jgi:divalent metal cation (Fe/Co/Zn/Cd) transporter
VLVDGNVTVRKGHDISEKVKMELLDKGPNIFDVVVHLEPYDN